MEIITLKEFWESEEELAIHCDTEEKAIKLCKKFNEMGKIWTSGRTYNERINYENYKEDTAYSNDGGYCSIGWFKEKNYKIYEFEQVADFIEAPKTEKQEINYEHLKKEIAKAIVKVAKDGMKENSLKNIINCENLINWCNGIYRRR